MKLYSSVGSSIDISAARKDDSNSVSIGRPLFAISKQCFRDTRPVAAALPECIVLPYIARLMSTVAFTTEPTSGGEVVKVCFGLVMCCWASGDVVEFGAFVQHVTSR